ncbi:MAG: hypothetical protein GX751_11535 [Desulfuromonadaceae bacterium]|nr:hypothetical protein [Desulfuromonadaceae bacterium]
MVTFTLSDGSRVAGDVFLHLFTFRHDSSQRLDELLNDDNTCFIPVKRDPEGSVILLNLNHVVFVEAERQAGFDDLMSPLGRWHTISVKTIGQEMIRGEILIDLPNEKGRAQDFFNQPVNFSPLFQGERVLYLNHNYILYAMD